MLTLVAACFLGACARQVEQTRPGALAAPEPIARGAEDGLEVRWWLTRQADSSLEAALRRFGQPPVGVTPEQHALLLANDLDVVSIRIEDLDALQSRLRLIGGIDRQWLGQAPFWTVIGRGPRINHASSLALDTGRLRLSAGRLVLLMRCWTMPVPSQTAPVSRLHLELIPQHREAQRDDDPLGMLSMTEELVLNEQPKTEDEKGLLLTRFHMSLRPEPGRALVLVPAPPRPGEDDEGTEDLDPEETEGIDAAPGLGQVTRDRPAAGAAPRTDAAPGIAPPDPGERARTLGEALMASRDLEGGPTTRAMLVLVPRVPERFELIRSGPQRSPRR